jgi:PIN domain nuclease of toxin-antitoxin system
MTYLFDTHTFLWLVNSPEVLPDPVLRVIQNHAATILISIVVPWEIAIKSKIGKLDGAEILKDFESKITKSQLTMLQTSVPQVIRSGNLPLHHRDPFDRLLIAQALDLSIPIVSNDRVFDLYGVQRIWG